MSNKKLPSPEEILGVDKPVTSIKQRTLYTLNGKDRVLIHINDALEAMKEYAKQVLMYGLEKFREEAALEAHYEDWDEKEDLVINDDNMDAYYAQPYLGGGMSIIISKLSVKEIADTIIKEQKL